MTERQPTVPTTETVAPAPETTPPRTGGGTPAPPTTTAAPEPAPPVDSPDNDVPPPADSPAERFEHDCRANPDACG